MIDRETALELLKKYTPEESQIIHAYCVEETMRRFATEYGHDALYWSLVGLLHDIDYGLYPEEHCKMAPTLLAEVDVDDAFIRAVVSHGWQICSDVEPVHFMEKVLYTIDELTGLIYATALMRPQRMVGMGVKSVKKKWSSPSFAAGVNREIIARGAELLGLPLETIITLTIEAMEAASEKIGL
ncbi:MAG: hydrolase [Sphaerochaeta sp.]|nr:hydrolase [Sphaerochaeta sp.]MDX9914639.1 hydrolase [Sphaerochaeta sp.]